MAIVPIEILKTKFESGDFPRSSDYQDLIDTLSSASGAITSTNDLSEGATNKYFTDERAQDALGNSLGTGLSYNDTTGAISVTSNTYDSYGSASTVAGNLATHESDTTTHGTTGNIVGTSDTQTLTNKTLTSPVINTPTGITKSDVGLANVDNTSDANKPVSTATQTALDLKLASATAATTYETIANVALKAPLAAPTFTGTVSGITATMVGLGNVDNTSDINKPVSTAQATAIATAKSETITQILGAGVPEALNTLDELAAALGDDANYAATITTSLGLKAPLASPTFTGTVSGVTKTHVGLGSVDNTADTAKPVSTATQTALDLKAPLASPTFTGTPTLPTGTIATTQTAANSTTAVATTAFVTTADNLKANLAGPTFTGTVTLPSTTSIGNVTSTEIGYVDGVTSAIQTQLDSKSPIASPTFTGTVTSTSKTQFGSSSAWIHNALDANWGFLYKPSQDGGAGTHGFLNTAGNQLARIDSGGNIIASGNVTAYSDERLKSNIKTIENALEKVSQLRGVSFEKNGENEIGVIAQEVQKVLPEVVQDGEYLSVAYGNIVGLLIEAIKEQQEQIEDLKNRIE
jgi:hypothetical protein